MLLAFMLPRNTIMSYLHIHAFFMAFFFYALGFFCRNVTNCSSSIKVGGFVIALLTYYLFGFRGTNGFVSGLFGDSLVWYGLHVCSGIFILLFLFELFEKMGFAWLELLLVPFKYVSRNALPIIAVHFWAILVYVVFFNKYIQPDYQLLTILIFVCVTVVILVPILNIYINYSR